MAIEISMRMLAAMLYGGDGLSRASQARAQRWAERHGILRKYAGKRGVYTTPGLLRRHAPHVADRLIILAEIDDTGTDRNELEQLGHLI